MKKKLTVIGTQDMIDLPEFDICELECKIDTGAFTSTIHCSKVEVVDADGVPTLNFCVLDRFHPQFNNTVHSVTEFKEKTVRSSNGVAETRYVVKTKAILFGKTYPITFTLSNRKKMRFPVLIGKKFLKNRFVVDVAQKDLSFTKKQHDLN